MAYIKLIRPLNLLIILFTQYMIRFAFFYPLFHYAGFKLQLNELVFAIFSLAFVFMAAGGYIINDYYDVDIDKINKPGQVIIGEQINSKDALRVYWIVSLIGLIMGCSTSFIAGLPSLSFVFLFYLAGLWYYSNNLKYQFITGNITVALFLALVPLTSGVIELYADSKNHSFIQSGLNLVFLFYCIAGISLFAFLSSFAREIVKDMEDIEGDSASECRTLPIVMGTEAARRIVQFLLLVIFFLLFYVQYQQWRTKDIKSLVYFTVFIQLPIIIVITMMNRAKASGDFHRISTWLKILMVSGISYLFVFAYNCFSQSI